MLADTLKSFTNIGSVDGVYFFWKCLQYSKTTKDTIAIERQHSNSKVNLDLAAAYILFEGLGLISIDGNDVSVNINYKSYLKYTYPEFVEWFSYIASKFFISEEAINLSSINYDSSTDQYLLPRSTIKIKYSAVRNLLISFGVLDNHRADRQYVVHKHINLFIDSAQKTIRNLTLEKLKSQLEEKEEQGERGELFVVAYEHARLQGHPHIDKVKRISIVDVSAGYDIISFNDCQSTELDRMIEVKTFSGVPHFFWSSNERRIAKLLADHYFIYLVDINKINERDYAPLTIQDPTVFFTGNTQWIVEEESVKITKAGV